MADLPSPRKSPRQARSQVMVETILQATARVLTERGYAGTNTNLVAECAGVSVGSIYQYFPNKDALITALHDRHSNEMVALISNAIAEVYSVDLQTAVERIVEAVHEAHLLEPEMHRALENGDMQCHDQAHHEGYVTIAAQVLNLLKHHRAAIRAENLELAVWTCMKIIETMVHSAVLDPPPQFSQAEIRRAIVAAVMGYLVYATPALDPATKPLPTVLIKEASS
ncbi:TetR/AcrR family transcriptional regulator [Silvimonas sp.]|uniref:TetR/AcrR family transcriptional regulator n=1 Tax=Silvimonas sp. TaxID=2650811 RepID=UPI00284A7E99|nr:TetR/AcrR family transcriptional regulator [Silvimonas sp.]MDR3428437.1 TetR/AcrR family transcriptional regulator [Silvimonas sp.]